MAINRNCCKKDFNTTSSTQVFLLIILWTTIEALTTCGGMSTVGTPNACVAPAVGAAPAAFAGALQFFAAAQCLIPESWPESIRVKNGDEFDFIVVGAGAAGAVVAARLSEMKNVNVLLIEAGGDPPVESIIPALHPTLVNTEYDWDTPTVNNSFSGQALKKFRISRGKVLGGGSSINFLMYVRGNPADYDEWANLGNEGWDWQSVLPYFKKSEQIHDDVVQAQAYVEKLHGIEGTGIKVTRANFDDQYERFLKVFNDAGFQILPENNGPQQLGFAFTDFTVYDGIRESTAQRYLLPNKNRTNLHILKRALVNKVIFDKKTKIADGVEVTVGGVTIKLKARKETILSAGTIGTAEILLKSGIGPKEQLVANKICQVAELPVGKNFRDHVFAPIVVTGKPDAVSIKDSQFGIIQYLYNRTGPLSSGPVPLINGFITVHEGQTYPDLQIGAFHFLANDSGLNFICGDVFQFNDEVCHSLQEINSKTEVLFIAVVLLHPKSEGYIRLGDHAELIVNPNYLLEDEDHEILKEGAKRVIKIVNSTSFQDSNPTVGKLNVRQCEHLEFNSDEYWGCYVRNMASTLLHPVGSCSMGKVVDNKLKVYEVSRLRVVDASIMPGTTSGNTNAPAVMVGEKGADLIKADH